MSSNSLYETAGNIFHLMQIAKDIVSTIDGHKYDVSVQATMKGIADRNRKQFAEYAAALVFNLSEEKLNEFIEWKTKKFNFDITIHELRSGKILLEKQKITNILGGGGNASLIGNI